MWSIAAIVGMTFGVLVGTGIYLALHGINSALSRVAHTLERLEGRHRETDLRRRLGPWSDIKEDQ